MPKIHCTNRLNPPLLLNSCEIAKKHFSEPPIFLVYLNKWSDNAIISKCKD